MDYCWEVLADIRGEPPWPRLLSDKRQTARPSLFCRRRRGTPCGLLSPARRQGRQVDSCRSRQPTLRWSASFLFLAPQFGSFWKSYCLVFQWWSLLEVGLAAIVDLLYTWDWTIKLANICIRMRPKWNLILPKGNIAILLSSCSPIQSFIALAWEGQRPSICEVIFNQ